MLLRILGLSYMCFVKKSRSTVACPHPKLGMMVGEGGRQYGGISLTFSSGILRQTVGFLPTDSVLGNALGNKVAGFLSRSINPPITNHTDKTYLILSSHWQPRRSAWEGGWECIMLNLDHMVHKDIEGTLGTSPAHYVL